MDKLHTFVLRTAILTCEYTLIVSRTYTCAAICGDNHRDARVAIGSLETTVKVDCTPQPPCVRQARYEIFIPL